MSKNLISMVTPDGEEIEEYWENAELFRQWAIRDSWHGTYTVYEEDEDGDFLVVSKGEC